MSGAPKEVLVFSKRFSEFSYGPNHPLKVERLQLTMDLIAAYGLMPSATEPWVEATPAEEQDLLRVHSEEYLNVLKKANGGEAPLMGWRYGLGSGDNPVFPGVYDWSLLVTGATVECGRQVARGGRQIAFNVAGGLHHAMPSRASGFCYLNDPAVGIARMVDEGLRVVYLDVDVHHGDGVEAAFYGTDRVLTVSLHQHGWTIFPGTGFPDEMGEGAGTGYAVNVPLAPGTDDDLYYWVFMEVVPPLVHAFRPDVLVTQLGTDALTADALGRLNLSIAGFGRLMREIKSWNFKWVALGGGGYRPINVARAWTMAWAVMRGLELPDELPGTFVKGHPLEVGPSTTLSDPPIKVTGTTAAQARDLANLVVARIKERIFPIVGA
ncbi:MAG: acetoin utilization protein AcuC [Nitrospirota bacterium]